MSESSIHSPAAERNEPRRHSIAAKIVFLVFLCTFLTALVVSGITVNARQAELRTRVAADFAGALERSRDSLDLWLMEGRNHLGTLRGDARARKPLVNAARKPTPSRRAEAVTALASFASQSIHFDAVALLSPEGEWLVHSEDFGPPVEPLTRLDPKRSTHRSVRLESGAVAVAVAPLAKGKADSGFVAARFDPALLAALLEEERHEALGALALTDAAGRILAQLDGPPGSLDHADTSAARLLGKPQLGVREYATPGGALALGARLPLDPEAKGEADWQLVAEVPHAVAFAPLAELVTRVFLVDLALSLAFIAAAYRISTRMLRPIEDLAEAARQASSGNLAHAIEDPGTHDEIGRLTRAFNEMMSRLRESQVDIHEANRELLGRNDELQRANEVLSQLSITDGLTKLHNHRHFQECLTREIKRQSRNKKPLSMLLVDLDDFKALNDRLGHASGDELLVRVASILDSTVRESDLLARYGGEEFVVLATETDMRGAIALAEKVRMNVEQAPHIVNESLRPVRITVSVGVAQYAGNRRKFFEAADRALYRAKDQGKNCVVADGDEDTVEGSEPDA